MGCLLLPEPSFPLYSEKNKFFFFLKSHGQCSGPIVASQLLFTLCQFPPFQPHPSGSVDHHAQGQTGERRPPSCWPALCGTLTEGDILLLSHGWARHLFMTDWQLTNPSPYTPRLLYFCLLFWFTSILRHSLFPVSRNSYVYLDTFKMSCLCWGPRV